MENPMLNHLIVTKILNSIPLSFEDFKSFRLVCSLWYALSVDKWRSSAIVRITDNNGLLDSDVAGVSIPELHSLHFRADPHDCLSMKNKPFARYRLADWISGYRSDGRTKNIWNKYISPSVEWLHIDYCYFNDSKQLEEIIFSCTNLKELVISGSSSGICSCSRLEDIKEDVSMLPHLKSLSISGGMPIQWAKILLHSPNLQTLTMKQIGSYDRATFPTFLIDLHQLEYCGRNPTQIRHLDIMDADKTFTDFVSLSSRDLTLETLSFCFDNHRPEHFIQPLLVAQARSLKVLKLRCSKTSCLEINASDFPYSVSLPGLKELYVWGNLIKTLNFLHYMPNLSKLHLVRETDKEDESESESVSLEVTNNLVMSKLAEFQIDIKLKQENVKHLKRIMPNLRKIRFLLSKETYDEIAKEWPEIQEVVGLCGSDIDENSNAFNLE